MIRRARIALWVAPCLLPAVAAASVPHPRRTSLAAGRGSIAAPAAPAPRVPTPTAPSSGLGEVEPARPRSPVADVQAPEHAPPAPPASLVDAATNEPSAPALDWLAETQPAPPAPPGRALTSVAFVLLSAAAAAAGGAAWQRRRRGAPEVREQEQIALLATRGLGSKQRLALVQVCGERLLLASCDGELSLISHLPADDAAGAETAEASAATSVGARAEVALAARRTSSEVPFGAPASAFAPAPEAPPLSVSVPREASEQAQPFGQGFAVTLADKLPAARVPAPAAPAPAPVDDHALSADLAGLRAWRARGPHAGEVGA